MTIPLGLKVIYTAWIAVWMPLYWLHHGPANLLWFCDLANLVVLVGLWRDSPLLLSSQLVAVGVPQLGWMVDYFGRLFFGGHPIGGTEYMFDPGEPLWLRSLSLFHLWMLPLLVWLVRRTGYDRRGVGLQVAISTVVVPLSMIVGTRKENLNWVWGPFGQEQTLVAPWLWVVCLLVLYPLVLFLPTHWVAAATLGRRSPSRAPEQDAVMAG
jgi:hypothetical protein